MGDKQPAALFSHIVSTAASSIDQTLCLLSEPAAAGGKTVPWKDVITSAEQVAKCATTAGVLWSRNVAKKDGKQNIRSFTEALQGFVLLCHGSTVGAGPTLLKMVHLAAKQVVDASLTFLRGAVAFSGQDNNEAKIDLPVLVGHIYNACEGVKKTPSDNFSAVGRSLTQVAVSVKDVIRELDDFKQLRTSEDTGEVDITERGHTCSEDAGLSDTSLDGSVDFNDELSAEEMRVVLSVKEFTSCFLKLLKELLYMTVYESKSSKETFSEVTVSSWEKILERTKDLGVGFDELGASLYPPQEMEALRARVLEMEGMIESLHTQVFALKGFMPEDIRLAIDALKGAGFSLKNDLDSSSNIGGS